MTDNSDDRIVTIFGGSKCRPDSEEYRTAEELGSRLAKAGFTICTGGYLGVMEAASRGARESGRGVGIVATDTNEPVQGRTEPIFDG